MCIEHLIVGGAQKCGTTWLQHVLDDNENFYCPSKKAEIHFFDREYNKGFAYYYSLYKYAKQDQLTVDVTPDYLGLSNITAYRIKEFQNQTATPIKFIFILRDPIERLVSAYKMKIRQGELNGIQDINHSSSLLHYGLYYQNLKKFLELFPNENIKIFLFEEIFTNKNNFWTELKNFLNISTKLNDSYTGKIINPGYFPRSTLLPLITSSTGKLLRQVGSNKIIHKIKTSKVYQWLHYKNIDIEKERFLNIEAEKIRKQYIAFYQQDVIKLGYLLGSPQRLTCWPNFSESL